MHIWKSCDIKWIAKSIVQLKCIREQDAKLPIANEDNEDAVDKYIQATRVTLVHLLAELLQSQE